MLVVDDDEDIRETLSEILDAEGYPVVALSDGQEALSYLQREGKARLVLLDLMMPRMDGWQLREAMTADPRLADIPVVVLTATHDPGRQQITAAEILSKPVSLDRLLEVVARYAGPGGAAGNDGALPSRRPPPRG